jgi:hypothetical protein
LAKNIQRQRFKDEKKAVTLQAKRIYTGYAKSIFPHTAPLG